MEKYSGSKPAAIVGMNQEKRERKKVKEIGIESIFSIYAQTALICDLNFASHGGHTSDMN